MKALQTSLALVLASTFAVGAARAQSPLTREQVKAEYDEAVRTGDLLAPGDSGMKLNEMYPSRYPNALVVGKTRVQVVAGKTREQVREEYAQAVRTGDILAPGDIGLKLNEEFPQRYAEARAEDSERRALAAATPACTTNTTIQ
jgi:hypothetical protein